jgi:hypothetical protein
MKILSIDTIRYLLKKEDLARICVENNFHRATIARIVKYEKYTPRYDMVEKLSSYFCERHQELKSIFEGE